MVLIKRLLIVYFLILVLPTSVLGLEFPEPQGYVNDLAQVLTVQTRTELERRLVTLEEETGIELVVVTVKSLQGTTVEDFATRLFKNWKVGKKGKDNGVLLLVAPNERKVRIEVGYGLEAVLTDGRAGRIIREELIPAFKESNFDQGIKAGVKAIEQVVRGDSSQRGEFSAYPDNGDRGEKSSGPAPIFVLVGSLIVFQYLAAFLGRTKAIWPGAVVGGVGGAAIGILLGSLVSFGLAVVGLAAAGLFLDYLLSQNYQQRQKAGLPTSWRHSWGGFSSGGTGFGGFGGGGSGGGGASGSW